jgi:hypothetical protein
MSDTDTIPLAAPRRRPVLDLTINLGHILTMTLMIGSVLTAYSNLDKRIAKQDGTDTPRSAWYKTV